MRVTSPKWGAPLAVVSLLWLLLSFPFGRRLRDIFEWYFLHGGWRLNVTTACDRRTRRLRLPSYFWRGITLVTLIVLVADDPSWDYAFGQCAPPATSNIVDNFALTRVTSYTYDFDGRLTQMNSPEGYINYGYDAATGRLLSTCTTNSYITNSYDALGRLKTVTALKRNGTNLLSPETTTYLYDGVGNRQEIDLPNGIKTTYLYDNLNRLTNLTHKTGSTIDAVYSYKLDATGRRTNAVEIVLEEGVGGYLTNTLTWQYDGMYRLTNEVSLCSSNAFSYTNAYVYGLTGNRLKRIRTSSSTITTTNLFDANDELLREVTQTGLNYTETNNYAYDANGSMVGLTNCAATGLSTNVYSYNLMNKLSSVTSGTTTTGFQYNDQGIRVRVTGASPKYYLIDANNHTGYQQILEEFTTLGSVPTRSYVIGDDVLAQADSGAASYLLYDGHGSTRQVADNSGGVSSRYNYDAYGVTQSGTTTLNPNPNTSLQYCGEQYDSALGMYNLRARYYNPANDRFNQRDVFEGSNNAPQSLHKYLYADANPVTGKDPTGYFTVAELMIFTFSAAVLGAIVGGAISKAVGGNGIKGFIYGAIAGGSAAALLAEGPAKLVEGLTSGLLQGLAAIVLDMLAAAILGQNQPELSEKVDMFFGGFGLGLFNAALGEKTEKALAIAGISSVTTIIGELLENWLNHEELTKDFIVKTIISAIIEFAVSYIFASKDELVFVVGSGKIHIVAKALEENPGKWAEFGKEMLETGVSSAYDLLKEVIDHLTERKTASP